jgi:lysophospholipase L1-like esterase
MDSINIQKKYNKNTRMSLYKLEKRYRHLAMEEKTGFISLLHAVSPSHYVDGLHPDTEGQKQIAAAVWKGLQKEN